MKSKMLLGLLVAAMVALAFGAVGTAAATAPAAAPAPAGVVGDVQAIDGATFTVATLQRGAVTVQTTGRTRFRAKDNPDFALADLKVGDRVAVQGRWAAAKLQANLVALIPAELRDKALGQVQSIAGSTIALVKADGSALQVVTTATTKFHARGVANPSLADIQPGDIVAAAGQLSGSTLTAAQVGFNTPREKIGPRAAGKISAIHGGTLTLDQPFGQKLTVTTDANTFVVQRGTDGLQIITVADLQAGEGVMVLGVRSSDGETIEAKAILAGDGEGAGSGQRLPAAPRGAPQFN